MRRFGIALATLVTSAICAVGPAAAQTTLSISSWLPPTHAVTRALVDWGKEVEQATSGRVKFNLLAKAVTSPPGTFDAIRDGLADISWTVDGYTPGRFIVSRVADFPILGETAEINSIAFQRIHDRYLAKAEEHKGVKVLAVFLQGPSGIFTTKKPVRTIADLDGMKFRIGGGMIAELSKSLGMNALLKPVTESYELLSTGVADGTLSSTEGIASFKLDKVIRYYTRVPGGVYNNSFSVFINPDAYNKIPAADRKILDEKAGENLSRLIGKYWNEADRNGVDVMKASGVEFIDADAAFVSGLQAKAKVLEEAWFKLAQEKGVDGPAALKALRDEVKKVSATVK